MSRSTAKSNGYDKILEAALTLDKPDMEIIKLAVKKCDLQTNRYEHPLHGILSRPSRENFPKTELIKLLLKEGSNPNVGLSYAALYCWTTVENLLLVFKYGADVNHKFENLNILELFMIGNKNIDILKALLNFGAKNTLGRKYIPEENETIIYIKEWMENVKVPTLRTLCIRVVYKNWQHLKRTQQNGELKEFPRVLLEFPDEIEEIKGYNNRIENYRRIR